MSGAAVLEAPASLIGSSVGAVRGYVFADAAADESCPACGHPMDDHRQVDPWDDLPPMLLCFAPLAGHLRCSNERGACRRDMP